MEMWKSKKVILVTLVVVGILTGSIAGVAIAQTSNGDQSQPQIQQEKLLDKVAQIYQEKTGVAIDSQVLKDAFAQAQSVMRDEALSDRLQKLVDESKMTQEQADQYKQWWQARPDTPLSLGPGLGDGMMGGRGGPGPGPRW